MLFRDDVTTLGLAFPRYGEPKPFGIKTRDRLAHVFVIGQTGTGKSTLLANLACQDAAAGHGFCLLDPHGDLAVDLHNVLQAEHHYWDVGDPKSPYGYNPLAPVPAPYRPLVASAFIATLKQQWPDAWGARMEHLMRYAILALLERSDSDPH